MIFLVEKSNFQNFDRPIGMNECKLVNRLRVGCFNVLESKRKNIKNLDQKF